MDLKLTYYRIKMADARCKEIVQELRKLPPIEYCPQETRGLNQEYIWSITFIINQCEAILESDEYNDTHDDMLYRLELTEFQEHYKNIKSAI